MTQPKFRVGDVVVYNDDAGQLILKYVKDAKARVKLGGKGIIVTVHNVGEFYSVSWFGGNGSSINEVLELKLCKGIRNTKLCDRCRYKIECRALD